MVHVNANKKISRQHLEDFIGLLKNDSQYGLDPDEKYYEDSKRKLTRDESKNYLTSYWRMLRPSKIS